MPLTPRRVPGKRPESYQGQQFLSPAVALLMQQERGGKIGEGKGTRPQVYWPVALRAVRSWLEPWIMLRRYWRGWSQLPPPPALQFLLGKLEQGHPIPLYSSA